MTGSRKFTPCAAITALFLVQPPLGQEQAPPFGGPAEIDFAEELWQALEERGILGEDAIQTHPFAGTSMHGTVIQYLSGKDRR